MGGGWGLWQRIGGGIYLRAEKGSGDGSRWSVKGQKLTSGSPKNSTTTEPRSTIPVTRIIAPSAQHPLYNPRKSSGNLVIMSSLHAYAVDSFAPLQHMSLVPGTAVLVHHAIICLNDENLSAVDSIFRGDIKLVCFRSRSIGSSRRARRH